MAAAAALEQGRACCARGAWRDGYAALRGAEPLAAEDRELLAVAAYMLGREQEHFEQLELAHQDRMAAGDSLGAAQDAIWIGMHLMAGGALAQGAGWLARAQRLVEREPGEHVQQGYLLLPLAFRHEASGEFDRAAAVAAEAVAIAERFGDHDLLALSLHLQGHMLVRGGHAPQGLQALDEAMVAVTAGELSPIARGVVYCGVILACQLAYEPRRAQEWTAALARWCERQPDMVAFSGRCHVHRAEIMQLKGAWADALEEARHAARRAELGNHRRALAEAAYVQGEVHRLRGRAAAAEDAYRDASRLGREPQPGLALLRLAQGKVEDAVGAITRALAETVAPGERAQLLPACAEIQLAAGDLAAAREACEELADIARGLDAGVLRAIVAQTRGAIELAAGDARAALVDLRAAWRVWEEVEAPYEAARARVLIGAACRALGDADMAALEREAARRTLKELGAAPDLVRLDARGADTHDLTARELEVLRLVAAGGTNKAIAAELVLSERTVDRHVSNIFAKLGVSSRAAATAHAYERHLV